MLKGERGGTRTLRCEFTWKSVMIAVNSWSFSDTIEGHRHCRHLIFIHFLRISTGGIDLLLEYRVASSLNHVVAYPHYSCFIHCVLVLDWSQHAFVMFEVVCTFIGACIQLLPLLRRLWSPPLDLILVWISTSHSEHSFWVCVCSSSKISIALIE